MKDKKILFSIVIIILLIGAFAYYSYRSSKIESDKKEDGGLIQLKIGWQIPWAIQGQIVQVLKNTNILEKNGIKGEFIGRTYGPELNELAMAGSVDVILTADQPAATLFAKNNNWIGISRLMYNRTLTYVPPKSPIDKVEQLNGKTIGIPIGAAAERITMEALKRSGIPKENVKIINLGIKEQGPLIMKNKDAKKWDQFDALSGFDPIPAIFESRGLIKVIDSGKVVSLVLMNKKFIEQNSNIAEKLNQAIFDAYDYYRQNINQSNEWFLKEAGLTDADQSACNIAASIEPNLKVISRKDIRITFNEEDFEIMQKGADFIEPTINEKINMKNFVSNQYADKAN